MRSRLARVGVVAFGLLALLGTTTPAEANTTIEATFTAEVTVHGGIGYPVTTLATPTPQVPPLVDDPMTPTQEYTLLETLAHAKGARHVCNLPLPHDAFEDPECLTNSHWVYDHERVISAIHDECFDAAVNVDKLTKAPAHAGACQFRSIDRPGLPNRITGHCGQSSGQIQVLFTDALGQDFILDLHFKTAGSIVFISGHWFKVGTTQNGLIVATADAVPEIVVGGPSCTNKSQERFIVVGTATAVTTL